MPDKDLTNYIIAYDISNPKRLIAVNKLVKTYGISLQYSVFIAPLNRVLLERLIDELSVIIDEKNDDVRIYPLPSNPGIILLGKQQLPEGIYLNQYTAKNKKVLDYN